MNISPHNIYGKITVSRKDIENHKPNANWLVEKYIKDWIEIIRDVAEKIDRLCK